MEIYTDHTLIPYEECHFFPIVHELERRAQEYCQQNDCLYSTSDIIVVQVKSGMIALLRALRYREDTEFPDPHIQGRWVPGYYWRKKDIIYIDRETVIEGGRYSMKARLHVTMPNLTVSQSEV